MEANLQHAFSKSFSNGINKNSEKELKIEIITDEFGFEKLEDEWGELTDKADTFIYQTFEWNRYWWKYFGTNKDLFIITLYEDETLLAVVPLFWDTFAINSNDIYSCLRLIGSSVSQPEGENLKGLRPYSDYLDAIIQPGYEEKVVEKLIHYFEEQELDFNEIILDEIPEDSCLWNVLLPILNKRGIPFTVENSSKCPIIKLGMSWDDYQQNQSKKARYNNNRALRMVDEDSKKGFHVNEAEDLKEFHEGYELLVKLHQERWNQLGFPGVFAEERMYNFQRDIIEQFQKKGWVQIRMADPVKDAGHVIAVDLLFKYKNRIYLVHRALDQDSKFSKAGPGNVLLSVAMKEAADEGYEAVDFLRGTEGFKFRTANKVVQNKKIVIENPAVNNRAKSRFLKIYIQLKRRTEIEWVQLLLFLNGKTMAKGITGYIKFIYTRFRYKFSSQNKG